MKSDEPPDGGGGNARSDRETSTDQGRKRRPRDSFDSSHSKRDHLTPPTASIQHSYTLPEYSGTKLQYSEFDSSPFIVHVSREEQDPSAGLSIRLLKFAKSIYQNKVYGILKDGIKSAGRNRIVVEFEDAISANAFLNHPLLAEQKFKAVIPTFNITRMGIIREIPVDWSMEEFLSSVECSIPNCKAIKARRLNRKVITDGKPEWIPTQTVVVTFLGQVLPERVFCCYTSLPVGLYTLPTIQCNNCCRFGHIKTNCRSKPRCFKCSQPHSGETCSVPDSQVTCLFCSGPHSATNSNCPEHMRQKSIKLVMSEENIPYSEASLRFRPVRRTFADSSRELSVSTPRSRTPSSTPTRPPMSPLTPLRYDAQSPSLSYRKTVRINRPPPPSLGKGYDSDAHASLTNTPKSSQPNGCALINSDSGPSQPPNFSLIVDLLFSLVKFISDNNLSIPNHVSKILNQISPIPSCIYGDSSSMELQEHSS